MTPLQPRIKNALDEVRILVLGTQVLLGFAFRSFFEKTFPQLPEPLRAAKVVTLALLLVAIVLLFLPVAHHRLVERGEATGRLHRFTVRAAGVALLPLAAAFGLDVFFVGARAVDLRLGVGLGAGTFALAAALWYGGAALEKGGRAPEEHEVEPTRLEVKTDQALTEVRVVLPGAQALLGFSSRS